MTSSAVGQARDRSAWEAWKGAFLTPDGRVVDGGQENASHSEGQGWGLLLAAAYKDDQAFERIYRWTEKHLAVRPDGLLAWRWLPRDQPPARDLNNASDGDIFYAWALLRASRGSGNEAYFERAGEIARAIAASLLVPDPRDSSRLLLLPGAYGFRHDDVVTVNPSYYMHRAIRDLGDAFDLPRLTQAADDGLVLLGEVSATGLVPDWIEVAPDGWRPSTRMSSLFGYDAMRVALYLVWSNEPHHPAVRRAMSAYQAVEDPLTTPTVIELGGATVREWNDAAGYAAIPALLACGNSGADDRLLPGYTTNQSYYPATLQLLTVEAAQDIDPSCLP